MGLRQKDWARRERARLIEMLGGRCVDCGATEGLEFDHRAPRTWVARRTDQSGRISRIRRELSEGVPIDLRCAACNKRKGQPRFDPRPPSGDTPF